MEKKQNKQLRELSEEELKLVNGGKEQSVEPQDPCKDQVYKVNNPDKCGFVINAAMEDPNK